MATLHHGDELKQLYKNIDLPEIDVSQRVMNRINSMEGQMPKRKSKKRIIVAVVAAATMILSTGLAVAMNSNRELANENGEVVLRLIDAEMNPMDDECAQKEEEIRENLEPGKAVIVYHTHHNTQASIITKLAEFDSIEATQDSCSFNFKVPTYLPSGYDFTKGYVNNMANDNPALISELAKEAAETGKDMVVRELEVTNESMAAGLEFKKGKSELKISMLKHDGVNEYGQWDDVYIETVQVNGRDAFYVRGKGDNDLDARIVYKEVIPNTEHTKVFYRNGQHIEEVCSDFIEYFIISKDGKLSKDELIKIAESMQ